MSDPVLLSIEARIRTTEETDQLAERIRESIAMIVGREQLEEFRTRVMPLVQREPRRR